MSDALWFHFPSGYWYWTYFHVLICSLCIFFGEISVYAFCLFCDWNFFFFYCWYLRVHHILVLYQICGKCLLSVCSLFFHSLNRVFCRQKLLLWSSVYQIFLSQIMLLVSSLRTLYLDLYSKDVSHVSFFLKVLYFTFKSLIHFALTLYVSFFLFFCW